jgi:hypothetical protein
MADDRNSGPNKAFAAGLPTGIGVGIAIGVGIGVALGNIAVGIGVGIALGAGLALAFGPAILKKRSADKEQDKPSEEDK